MSDAIQILYVDASSTERELVIRALTAEDMGYQLNPVSTPVEVEEKLRSGDYNLVLTDLEVPGFADVEIIDFLRAQNPRLPIIIIVSNGSEELAVECMKRGAADYVLKTPQQLQRLSYAIEVALERSRLRREREQAEEELRRSEKRYEHIAANVPGVVYQFLLHPDGSMEWPFIGESCRYLFGIEPDFIRQNPHWPLDAVHPEDRPGLEQSIAEVAATLQPWNWEGRLVLSSGEIKWVQGTSRPELQDNGDILADGLFLDITERKHNEENRRFEAHLLNTVGQAVIATDLQGNITYWNRAAEEMCGWSTNEVMGHNVSKITVPQVMQEQATEIMAQLQEGNIWEGEFLVQRRDGTTFPALVTDAPVQDEQGNLTGIIGIFTDISEQKQMEQALQMAHQEIADIFESITEAFFAVDRDWNFTYINQSGYRLHNREPGSLPGKNLWAEFPEAVGTTFQQQYEKAMRERIAVTFEEYYAPLDKWGEVRVYPFEDGISIYVTDVTERREREVLLIEMESRFRRLADANVVGVCISGHEGMIYESNDFLLNLFGYSRQELQEGKLRWDALIPPEYAPLSAKVTQELVTTGALAPVEIEYLHKDGSRVPILLGGTVLEGADNKALFFILDLTWQKQAEIEIREYAAKVERSNRELQEFAYVASHDLQEPLRKIESFSERLQEDVGPSLGDAGQDYLQRMQNAVQRMRIFINELLALSRVETNPQPMGPIDLAQIAAEVVSDLETQIKETSARVEVGELATIEADALQMRQLLQNLIGNALKFRRDDEPPLVQVQGQLLSSARTTAPIYQLSISDNGIGFSEKSLERIFQPFVRLHGRSKYEGSGMGLTLCRKIAERHGGSITAKSSPGEGSTFLVDLPVKQPRRPVSRNGEPVLEGGNLH